MSNRGICNPLGDLTYSKNIFTVALCFPVHLKSALSCNNAEMHADFYMKFAINDIKYIKVLYKDCTLRIEVGIIYSAILSNYI